MSAPEPDHEARQRQYRFDLHDNGVHLHCRPGSGHDIANCRYAGKVELVHSHSFDGPLVCGCVEWAS
ncbi:hypothetical protein ACFQ34_33915 [Pseudonocardia benzenivorans]|uniref:Uncharacterized protein n=1 Tax=Pseudonocardia benzenivorans TaxID=228005 RepID=A0ABW3VUV2_9PSEU